MCHTGESISTPARGPTCQHWHDLNFIIYFSIYFKIARVFRENMAKLAQVKKGSEWNTLCNTGGEKAYLAKEF